MKKDNIEDIYSELEGFSKEPPKELWDNIEARLHPKKKRRGILWFWGSAAAVLLVLFGYVFTNSVKDGTQPTEHITDTEQPKEPSNNKLDSKTTKPIDGIVTNNGNEEGLKESINDRKEQFNDELEQKQLSNSTNPVKQKEKRNSNLTEQIPEKNAINKDEKLKSKLNEGYAQTINKDKINDYDKSSIDSEVALIKKDENINKIEIIKDVAIAGNDSISQVKVKTLLDISETLLAENKTINDSINTDVFETSKWSVEVLGGLSNTAAESTIQDTKVNTASQNDFVYTFKVAYAITDRLVIKSGIGKNVLGQEINNIGYASSENAFSADASQGIVDNEYILFIPSEQLVNDGSVAVDNYSEGSLQQQFNYIQVPFEVSYKLIAKNKYDVSLGVGGNVNFITSNKAFLDGKEIGENLAANSTIFGGTINSNISYEFTKKWILFFEPSYNYFQKPIDNNNQSFSNTQLRFLFGLRFRL
ncbi:hypothetical protein [Winogradskyella pulchriflava]|uniref:Outer membrane protein beta-barrel domain-containing protein n=1 Tax=Winogradskyella pulchriflava TaxID=1110688 RepID=A0ABV6Q876_9FLAO